MSMRQIALPLSVGDRSNPSRIVIGAANEGVINSMAEPEKWPFRTAILSGPPRSGKSLVARWFEGCGKGKAIDDAHLLDEDELFHLWNRAQESKQPLLVINGAGEGKWRIELPDLASRLGSAMHLRIGEPDDAMLAELILIHAGARGLALDDSATAYLVPRCNRSHFGVEKLIAAIDRLSLERKQAATMAIWREALSETGTNAE